MFIDFENASIEQKITLLQSLLSKLRGACDGDPTNWTTVEATFSNNSVLYNSVHISLTQTLNSINQQHAHVSSSGPPQSLLTKFKGLQLENEFRPTNHFESQVIEKQDTDLDATLKIGLESKPHPTDAMDRLGKDFRLLNNRSAPELSPNDIPSVFVSEQQLKNSHFIG